MLSNFSYIRAGSLKEASDHLMTQGAMLHAGGTDLISCFRDDVFSADKVVSINRLKDLQGIKKSSNGGLSIGALTTITEISENPLIRKHSTALSRGASEVASPQLRNQGTIGGNLCQKPRCWYYRGEFHCLRKGGSTCYAAGGENQFHCIFGGDLCYIVHPSDTAPPLVALGASVRIKGRSGSRVVPVEKFHVLPENDYRRETILEPGEIVTEIIIPPVSDNLKSSYRKVRARRSWDFALAGIALAIEFDDSRVKKAGVVFSGAAPVPWRSKEVENIITGEIIDDKIAKEAARAAVRNASPMSKNQYKIPLLKGIIEEELMAMASSQDKQ